jgi:hypothetical protein
MAVPLRKLNGSFYRLKVSIPIGHRSKGQNSGFRIQDSGFKVQGARCKIQSSKFMVNSYQKS